MRTNKQIAEELRRFAVVKDDLVNIDRFIRRIADELDPCNDHCRPVTKEEWMELGAQVGIDDANKTMQEIGIASARLLTGRNWHALTVNELNLVTALTKAKFIDKANNSGFVGSITS